MSLLPHHRAHDYRALIIGWRAVAQKARLKMQVLTEVSGHKVWYLESTGSRVQQEAIYLSSGVHGDEPGAAWGLLKWAQAHIELLRKESILICPCLNPHGLIANTRVDHRGEDINRRFHLEEDEVCGPWRRMTQGRHLKIALCLHEDYDAQGCYVYELSRYAEPISYQILQHCTHAIPPDSRSKIDISRARQGVIRRRRLPRDMVGLPEAMVLHHLGCPLTLTFETPSEFSLDDRVQTQADFISAALSFTLGLGNTEK